jgi:hypothetical protein
MKSKRRNKKPRLCRAGIFLRAKRIANQRDDGGEKPLEENNHRQNERSDVVEDQQKEIPDEKNEEKSAGEV